jgi:hypothetical protein
MWDDRRNAGVVNDFGSARLVDRKDTTVRSFQGALPFFAIELGPSGEENMRECVSRLYRHDTESFT